MELSMIWDIVCGKDARDTVLSDQCHTIRTLWGVFSGDLRVGGRTGLLALIH